MVENNLNIFGILASVDCHSARRTLSAHQYPTHLDFQNNLHSKPLGAAGDWMTGLVESF